MKGFHYLVPNSLSYGFEDIWISWITDDHGGNGEKFTKGGSELKVVSIEVMDIRLGKNGIVLQLSSSDGWAVVRDQDEFGLAWSEGFDGVSVSYYIKKWLILRECFTYQSWIFLT